MATEQALRGVAIGRRNYLFAGVTVIYLLIGTTKLNGVNPKAWLRHVLTNIADHRVNWVDKYLP